jgi:excisionase family DNA binding protein
MPETTKAPNRRERRHPAPEPMTWTIEDVLTAVPGMSRSKLYLEIRSGRLPSTKIGTRRVVRPEDVRDWLDRRYE